MIRTAFVSERNGMCFNCGQQGARKECLENAWGLVNANYDKASIHRLLLVHQSYSFVDIYCIIDEIHFGKSS